MQYASNLVDAQGFGVTNAWHAGFQSRPASAQQAEAWPAAALPNQAVLHKQHANHPAISPGFQLVLHLTAAVQALWQLPARQAVGPLASMFLYHLHVLLTPFPLGTCES